MMRRGTLVWIRSGKAERRFEGLRVAAGLAVWSEDEPVTVVWEAAEGDDPLPSHLQEEWRQHLAGLAENAAACWKRGPVEEGWAAITPEEWQQMMREARVVLEF